jgi:hypothetical protein
MLEAVTDVRFARSGDVDIRTSSPDRVSSSRIAESPS